MALTTEYTLTEHQNAIPARSPAARHFSKAPQPPKTRIPAQCLQRHTHQPLWPQTLGTLRSGPAVILFQPIRSAMAARKNIGFAGGLAEVMIDGRASYINHQGVAVWPH
jgi:hypothetical protein